MQDIRKSSSWWILAAKPHDQSVFFFLGRPDSLTPACEKTFPQQESDTVFWQCVVKKMNRDAFISSQCPVLNGWTVYSFFIFLLLLWTVLWEFSQVLVRGAYLGAIWFAWASLSRWLHLRAMSMAFWPLLPWRFSSMRSLESESLLNDCMIYYTIILHSDILHHHWNNPS